MHYKSVFQQGLRYKYLVIPANLNRNCIQYPSSKGIVDFLDVYEYDVTFFA
jgi:hypothetical protein